MENENHIRLGILTSDGALYRRLTQLAELWSQEMCVRLEVSDGRTDDWDMLIFETGESDASVEQRAAYRRLTRASTALIALAENSRQAIASYRSHPDALLQRNADFAKLSAALNRCFPAWSRGMQWLELPYQRELVRVPVCRIQYVEAQGRNTCLQCAGGGRVDVSRPMGQVAELLPQPPFLRCQKSFVVRISAVKRVQNGILTLSNGQEISVSRKQLPEVRQKIELWNSRF